MHVALIGCGNMGSALLRGMVRTGLIDAVQLCNRTRLKAEMLAEALSVQLSQITIADSAIAAATGADVILLALEPDGILPMLDELATILAATKPLVISVAAGVSLAAMQQHAPKTRLMRLMPNTPVSVGEGASGFICGDCCLASDAQLCQDLLAQTGLCLPLQDEGEIQAVVSLAGSAPAFLYEILDAMLTQGIAQGLSPETALALATQSMKGAATLQQQTGKSPKALRNAITSPNGATLAGLRRLNSLKIKENWQEVLQATAERFLKMEAEL